MKQDYPAIDILKALERRDLLPVILFRSSRKQCDVDVESLDRIRAVQLPDEDRERMIAAIDTIVSKYSLDPEMVTSHIQYPALISVGVGAHHAGQLLIWRLVLEELMSRGLLRMMVATGTVAAGVDFPARTVVITAHSRRGNEGYQLFTSAEFQQMSGRAGRRGKDIVGYCLVAPSPFCDARLIAEVAKRPPEPLRSAYFAAPATVLNILRYRNVDDLRYIVTKSLASFVDAKSSRSLRETIVKRHEQEADHHTTEIAKKKFEKRTRREMRQAEELEMRQISLLDRSLTGLERLGFVTEGHLSPKGTWAANLCTTLVLEIAEAIDAKVFDGLSSTELAGLIAAMSGDAHKTYLGLRANPIKKELFVKLKEVIDRVTAAYERPPTISHVEVIPNAAQTVITWMEAESWQEFSGLLRLGGVAEGDVARLMSQTADSLNQISRLADSHPLLAATAEESRARILRPPFSEIMAETSSQAVP